MTDDGLVAALARCQARFPAIVKSHTNPAFKGSQYADVADVLAAVRPVLAAEGIALVQSTEMSEWGWILTTALHLGHDILHSRFPMNTEGLTAQQVGSLMTYHRRYQLCALLGVHPVGDDDDGNLAATAPVRQRYEVRDVSATEFAAATGRPASMSQPEKPIAAMTMSEIIAWARENGIPLPSGSKAELIRHLQPLVNAASGAEPFSLEGAEPLDVKDDVQDKPFEPVVANPAATARDELRLLKPDARASVRRGE